MNADNEWKLQENVERDSQANPHKPEILNHFFSNLELEGHSSTPRVHALKNMPGLMAAALITRFSRATETNIAELFWKEFIEEPTLGEALIAQEAMSAGIDGILAQEQARKMIRRVIDGFGDDSVREAASGYAVVQDFSVLTAFEVFDHHLITGIEASTRYIEWGEKDENEKYRYNTPDVIKDSEYADIFEGAMDQLFDTYRELWQPVWDYVAAKNPREEGVSEAAYNSAIRGRVCDNLRKLLPLGIRTNFGIHATYRTLSEVVMNLRASKSSETVEFANQMAEQLKQVNPEFIGVVDTEKGELWAEHQRKSAAIIHGFSADIEDSPERDEPPGVELQVKNIDYLVDLATTLISVERPELSVDKAKLIALRKIHSGQLGFVLKALGEARTNRRHKINEALGAIELNVIFRGASFGTYKDLHRHRNVDFKSPPDFSGSEGVFIPQEIHEIGGQVLDKYLQAQQLASNARRIIQQTLPEEAKRLLTHGTKTTFHIHMGLAEAYWISELRSIASGDPEYRWFAQQLWEQLKEKIPEIELLGSFVDENDYPLNRIREAVAADNKGKL